MKNWSTLEPDKYRLMNKHYTRGRAGQKVQYVVIHHNGGKLSTEGCWQTWQTRKASCHYQVEADGTIGQLVKDGDTAWHTGAGYPYNERSIGIEHANSGSPTSPVTQATLENGAHLTAAICVKFGLGRPRWLKNVFPHQYMRRLKGTSTDCPGHLMGDQNAAYMARAQYWYDQMTGKAAPAAPAPAKPAPAKPATPASSSFVVTVTATSLNVRKGPGTNYGVATTVRKGERYTIVATNGKWGKLKSGVGWVHLDYTRR